MASSTATSLAAAPASRSSSARRRGTRIPARAFAVCLLAASATLGAIASAAHYASGAVTQAPPVAGSLSGGKQKPLPKSPAPQVRLADSGDSWPRSFFESLMGSNKRSEPRPARPPPAQRNWQQPTPRSSRPVSPRPSAIDRRDSRHTFDNGATYRTMCVRLCDGYYWPISYSSPASSFERDSQICQQSCSQPAALFTYPNPGGEPEEMVDLTGRPYASLKSAFVYRTSYNATCKCRPDPWEKEALERHRDYVRAHQSHAGVQSPKQR